MMNIGNKLGTFTFQNRRVRFATFNVGFTFEQKLMERLGFKIGNEYAVSKLEVEGWSSRVYLAEFPDHAGFNTMFFEDVIEEVTNGPVMEAERRKVQGMEQAVSSKRHIFDLAKDLAVNIAARHPSKEITADEVQIALINYGYDPSDLGNAAGALFRGKQWSFTGEWRKSIRITNHRRQNRVWRLIDGF